MLPIMLSLPPSQSHADRRVVYRAAQPGDYPDGRDGTLTLIQRASTRPGAKVSSTTFAVERQDDPLPGLRAYLLANLTDPGRADVHQVVLGSRTCEDHCDCEAGQFAGRYKPQTCRHVRALRALHDEGELE